MATILKTTGELINVEPQNNTDFSYSELKTIVGGYIEIVQVSATEYMVVYEEGHLIDLPFNAKATEIYSKSPSGHLWKGHEIVGDVLICNINQIQ